MPGISSPTISRTCCRSSRGPEPIVRNALGGWSTSGILKASSGLPFNVFTGQDTGDGTFEQRPNLVPGVPIYTGFSPARGLLNPAAFSVPTVVDPATGLKLGYLLNNYVHMPFTLTMNWALAKRLYTGEKFFVDFVASSSTFLITRFLHSGESKDCAELRTKSNDRRPAGDSIDAEVQLLISDMILDDSGGEAGAPGVPILGPRAYFPRQS